MDSSSAVQIGTEATDHADYVSKARAAGWSEPTAFDYAAYERTDDPAEGWMGNSAVYEWRGEYGDVGPSVSALEKELFGEQHRMREGAHRQALHLEVTVDGPTKCSPIRAFDDAGLHPVTMENIKLCGYATPTPIQSYTIPAVNLGYDVVGIAQTGSGKTAAYLIPILSRLMGKAKKLAAPRPEIPERGFSYRDHGVRAEPLVVIVVPTRELAIQIFDEARRMCYRSMLRPAVVYGGLPMGICREELAKGCDVLVGTPGRLCDIMNRPDMLTMNRVKYTVVDEADEMLDQDWEEELNKIMAGGDANEDADHMYLMFSATFPKAAREMARKYMERDYVRIAVGRPGQSHKNIRQAIVYVDQDKKEQATFDLLFSMEPGRTLIFCNSKITVDLLDAFLHSRGLPTTSIHAGRSQHEREDAIRAFRTGKAPILVATGVSARGWDVMGINHVINYDLPSTMHGGIQEYIHRIGRTARIGHQGLATSFYNDRDEGLAQDLVNILVECDCEVPDFLQHLAPEDGKIQFDDDTDEDEAGGGVGFGTDDNGVAVAGWGSAPATGVNDNAASFTPSTAAAAVATGW